MINFIYTRDNKKLQIH